MIQKNYELGKIMETYFEKDCNTSWVIDALTQTNDAGYVYDTLKLLRVFHLRFNKIDEAHKNTCFNVSLYVKRDEDCSGEYVESKLTLSKIRNAYSEKYFDEEDAESEVLLSAIIPQLGAFDREEKVQDIMFSKSITFKAQALENWSQKGKTKTYHIIGVCLEKVL